MAVQNPPWNRDPRVVDDIVRELSNLRNPDSPQLRIEDSNGEAALYSPNQLIAAVRIGSEVGRKIYGLHIMLREMESK